MISQTKLEVNLSTLWDQRSHSDGWNDIPFFNRKYMGVSKNRGKTTKMDGLFHGKPYEQMG